MGVTATIINDGSGTPYRLALSSDSNGVNNSMKITVSGDATVSSLLAHDPAGTQNLAQTVTAQNADFKVNGVTVSKASNTVSDVIQGVTLTLSKVTASPETLTVARDTVAVSSSIAGFVKAYNDLAATLKNISAYDAASQKGAILQGDSTVRSLQSQLRSMLSTPVVGTSGELTTLSDVGVTFQKDGTLKLDQTKLDSVMASNFSDIASLFSAVGKATDSLVSFSSATSSTKAGNYAVNITQLATRGTAVGSAAANTTISSATNDALTLSVNGVSASIVLSAGTYTATTLAAELQSKINSVSALSDAGISVAVTQSGGVLTITSSSYGSASVVDITGGNGTTDLLGTPTETGGVNVAGSIGAVTATGSGQILTAGSGDPQGLSIAINGGTTGARGTLNYSQGYATLLSNWSISILASDGILTSRTDGIGRTITDIGKRRTELETRLIGIEKRYRAQFTALDAMLASMNTTSTYLTQQLDQLAKL
jgi:flagellar hook-associated protein 2